MEKGLFHRNVFDAEAALRLRAPVPPVSLTADRLKDSVIQRGHQSPRPEGFSVKTVDGEFWTPGWSLGDPRSRGEE